MKRFVGFLLAALMMASVLTACAQPAPAETAEARIERVLTLLFTCPDEGTTQYMEGMASGEDLQTLETALSEFVAKRYSAADFTENCHESLYRQIYGTLLFPTFCAQNDKQLKPTDITVALLGDAQDHVYTFTATLTLTADGGSEEIVQTGRVQTDEAGLISSFSLDDSELLEKTME